MSANAHGDPALEPVRTLEPAPSGPGGRALSRISTRIVQLHKEHYGKGPTAAKTYLAGDLVVVLMRGGLTNAERTLLREGRRRTVVEQRTEFNEVMAARFKAVVEEELGAEVEAFIAGTHHEPDVLAGVFVLATPADGT